MNECFVIGEFYRYGEYPAAKRDCSAQHQRNPMQCRKTDTRNTCYYTSLILNELEIALQAALPCADAEKRANNLVRYEENCADL